MSGKRGRRRRVVDGVPPGLEALSFEGDGEYIVLTVPLPDWKLPPDLTRAECEVARALLAGQSAATIAKRRGTSVRTVTNQVQAIYQKAGVGSLGELAARCVRSR